MLNEEIAAFEQRLPQLLGDHEGQFAVLRGGEICHLAADYATALGWAYDNFGLQSFLVKQVTAAEPVVHFTRLLAPCDR